MMPLVSAFPLGLTLVGTSSYTLADGTTSPKLLARGTVSFGEDETLGTIVLETNECGVLLGMDYLRKAVRALIVSDSAVTLVDEEYLRPWLAHLSDVPPPPV